VQQRWIHLVRLAPKPKMIRVHADVSALDEKIPRQAALDAKRPTELRRQPPRIRRDVRGIRVAYKCSRIDSRRRNKGRKRTVPEIRWRTNCVLRPIDLRNAIESRSVQPAADPVGQVVVAERPRDGKI